MFAINNFREFREWSTFANIIIRELLCSQIHGIYIYIRSGYWSGNRTFIPVVWLARPSHLIAGALRAGRDGLAAVTISSHLFSTNQMLLAGIRANSIHSLLSHAYILFLSMAMDSFWLEMEPPDAERVAVRSRDRSHVSSLKESVSRRTLISQSARPGVYILSRFLNV